MQELTALWLPRVKHLTRLRVLRLQYLEERSGDAILSSEDLEEEQRACEELRAEGCPNIIKVCFNPRTVWTFCQVRGQWEREDRPKDRPLFVVKI